MEILKSKALWVGAIVTVVVVAIIFRVPKLKSAIIGA